VTALTPYPTSHDKTVLPDQELNAEGVDRMCRMLAVLQLALGVLCGKVGKPI
jgi:hypothetical protein